MNKITGLIAAPFTPFNQDKDLNLAVVDKQLKQLLADEVKGVFVGGTTGEAMSLTIDERKVLLEKWIDVSPKGFKVLAQCGHTTLTACKALARHAQKVGAYGIGAMGPFFYKPASVNELVSFSFEIALSAPELPFYYYHIPSMTQLHFPMIDFLKDASELIPNLAGIKYTHGDLMDFKLCQAFQNHRFDMLYGRDETLICGLALGAMGAIGSTYNYYAPVYQKIIRAWEKKEVIQANELQHKVMQFIQILHRYGGGIVVGKAIMQLIGIDCGLVRPPLKAI